MAKMKNPENDNILPKDLQEVYLWLVAYDWLGDLRNFIASSNFDLMNINFKRNAFERFYDLMSVDYVSDLADNFDI